MHTKQFCLRLLAYAKASLLMSLEGLNREDILWQPEPGKNNIGWNACHVGQFIGSLIWFFDDEPDWECLDPFIHFGHESDPDKLRDEIPDKEEIVRLIHKDWELFLVRFQASEESDFEKEVPLNNPDGETLLDMCHRTAWHAHHHIGLICALRSMQGKPTFPRPTFGSKARRELKASSETRWEDILTAGGEEWAYE
ncbi:MAG: DinB family protein [Planctomycetota bacterium]|nr:DinB family protein [Planctomycetota bacterium]MDP6503156.1 DinB family protein [Planctomycetota bacterium]